MPVIEIEEIFVPDEYDGGLYMGGVDLPQTEKAACLPMLPGLLRFVDLE